MFGGTWRTPHAYDKKEANFSSAACTVLQRIAFPVVSMWCQREDVRRLPRLRE
jgi:hypothetical protein